MSSLIKITASACLAVSCGIFSTSAIAQSTDAVDTAEAPPPPVAASGVETRQTAQNSPYNLPAFSRVAVGGGISLLGIGMEVSTNLNEHLNVRAIGNVFKYSNSFTISGVPTSAHFNLGSAGGMVDYYPFHVGWRVSGGLLFVNQNEVNATANIPGGDTITLNGQDYVSANPNPATGATPLNGHGRLNLHATNPGFMVTTGWGNHVRRSGHWTVPVEIGVAFVGTPKVTTAIGGWACTDASQTYCTNIADPNNPIAVQFQNNLNAQVSKWNSDISWLKSYPIFTTGIAYSFSVRRAH